MTRPARRTVNLRLDLQIIADMVEPRTRVLDIGCGDGALLEHLVHAKGVDGRGIELSQAGVNACVSHGLPVIQGDADTDLSDYPARSFDYAVLSQTLQATRDPKGVLLALVRIGRNAIVSIPNFGYWRMRWHLLVRGHMAMPEAFRHRWHDTPNIHPCTIADFIGLCDELGIRVLRSISIDRRGRIRRSKAPRPLANLLDEQAIFLLAKDQAGAGVPGKAI
ncbi:MAG TPA: methionine biosynthesis protein MetW [Alphaproteobacteria bacterium]|nr:methionine biosynthesis protein MetW [Alphaproteobacteria bacterium]